MHRAIAVLLTMLISAGWAVGAASPDQMVEPIRVGVFTGHGASAGSIENAYEALRIDPAIRPTLVSAAQVQAGALDGLDVILFPGGGGGRQFTDLGERGVALVRDFVLEKGRGAVGVCAGAYLLSDTPGYTCLRLCPLRAIDREHDERGHGLITWAPTPRGLEFFPELAGRSDGRVYYYEGPILVPTIDGPPRFTILATMVSDVHLENDAPAGMTPGRPLFVQAEAGKGRVFLSAGHPETTPGLRWIVCRAARWTARRDAVPYPDSVVRPGLLGQEILYDKPLRDEESALFQTLMYGVPQARMAAIRRLTAIRSWDGPRWIRGFVRSDDADVRVCAARALLELESTASIPDIAEALRSEAEPAVRADLAACLARLKAMVGAEAISDGAGVVAEPPQPGPRAHSDHP
jgi:putative intracellular protease/amidase